MHPLEGEAVLGEAADEDDLHAEQRGGGRQDGVDGRVRQGGGGGHGHVLRRGQGGVRELGAPLSRKSGRRAAPYPASRSLTSDRLGLVSAVPSGNTTVGTVCMPPFTLIT